MYQRTIEGQVIETLDNHKIAKTTLAMAIMN